MIFVILLFQNVVQNIIIIVSFNRKNLFMIVLLLPCLCVSDLYFDVKRKSEH